MRSPFLRPLQRVRRAVLVAALALTLPSVAPAQQHFPASEDVQLMLRYLVEDGETPGIVLGLIDEDGSTRILHYGDAGPGARPLGPRSVFEIGSITKTFTATLLADMVARGEMALDDPVRKYLPDHVAMPTWEGREITLQDLATHHSGLPRMPDNFDPTDPANPYADYTVEDLYDFLGAHELRRAPGARYEYSNLAVGLLGHVLELSTGKTYETLVRERILEPLGMSTTGVALEGDVAAWMTRGHDGAGEVVPFWNAMAMVGAGGLRSNAEDMLAYLAAQMGPAGSDIERAMRITHEPRVELENGAGGLGWGIRDLGMRRIITHGGGTGGFSTLAGFDPGLGVGFVMLTNTGDFDDDLGIDLLRRGTPISTPTVEVPRNALETYAGVYGPNPSEAAIVVRLEDEGWLTMQAPGNVRFRMYADSDSSFYVRRTPWRFTFQKDDEGRVAGIVADIEGTERRVRKLDLEMPDPRVHAGNPVVPEDLAPLTPAELARYEGRYAIQLGARTMELRVFVEDGELRGQPAGQRASPLIPQGEHEFIAAAETGVRLVFTLEGGRAEGVTLHQGGRSATGERLEPGEAPPGAAPPSDVRDLPVTAEDIARYEGTYLLQVGARTMELRIYGDGGRLVSQAAGQRVAPLRYQGDHTFVPDFDDTVRLVFTVEDGRATRVTLRQGGGEFVGERRP